MADKLIPGSVLKLIGDAVWPPEVRLFQPIFDLPERAVDPAYYFSRSTDGSGDYLVDCTGLGHADVQ